MKMMIVILGDGDAMTVLPALLEKEFRVTRVASTGGFLRRGNTTLLIGAPAERIDEAFEIIRSASAPPATPGQRRATVFVLDIERFEQL